MTPKAKRVLTAICVILAVALFVVWSSIRENKREDQQKKDWSSGYEAGLSDGIDDANEGWTDSAYDSDKLDGASADYTTAYLVGYAEGFGSQRYKVGYYRGYTDAQEGAEYKEDVG